MQVLTEPFVRGINTEGDLIDAGYPHWAALGGEVGGSAAKIGDPGAVVCLAFWSWESLGMRWGPSTVQEVGGREQTVKTWFWRALREGQLSVASIIGRNFIAGS